MSPEHIAKQIERVAHERHEIRANIEQEHSKLQNLRGSLVRAMTTKLALEQQIQAGIALVDSLTQDLVFHETEHRRLNTLLSALISSSPEAFGQVKSVDELERVIRDFSWNLPRDGRLSEST